MDDKNPLQFHRTNDKILNKRGRPATEKIKKFGPQPRSIIAQMLSEMKSKDITKEKHTSQNDKHSQDVSEAAVTYENRVCQTRSLRSCSVTEHKKHMSSPLLLICDYPNCNYSCKLSSNLTKHKRVHTNEKPYLCDRCSFRTNFVNSLKAHKRTHTDEKPYKCDYCLYKCNSSSNLKKHCHLRHPDGNYKSQYK